MMDGRRMDAEGGRVVHRERSARKLAVVVAVQNVLVLGCLLATLYVYWGVQTEPDEDVHIKFSAIAGSTGNVTLKFDDTQSVKGMSVADHKISIFCTGPYILYMNVCISNTGNVENTGILQLQVEDSTTPAMSFILQASGVDCRGLQSIVYLKAHDKASMHWYANEYFKIKSATLGLSYLLGGRCYF